MHWGWERSFGRKWDFILLLNLFLISIQNNEFHYAISYTVFLILLMASPPPLPFPPSCWSPSSPSGLSFHFYVMCILLPFFLPLIPSLRSLFSHLMVSFLGSLPISITLPIYIHAWSTINKYILRSKIYIWEKTCCSHLSVCILIDQFLELPAGEQVKDSQIIRSPPQHEWPLTKATSLPNL